MVQEYKRTCKACGKVWHSLVMREKMMKKNSCDECGETFELCGGCSDSNSRLQWKGNIEARDRERQSQMNDLTTCPNCGSSNYSEEIISHEEQ